MLDTKLKKFLKQTLWAEIILMLVNKCTDRAEPAKIAYEGWGVGGGHACKVTRPPCKQASGAPPLAKLIGSSRIMLALKIPFIAISLRWTHAQLRSLCSKSYAKLTSPDVCFAEINISRIEMTLCSVYFAGFGSLFPRLLGVLGNVDVTLRTSLIAYLVWSIALDLNPQLVFLSSRRGVFSLRSVWSAYFYQVSHILTRFLYLLVEKYHTAFALRYDIDNLGSLKKFQAIVTINQPDGAFALGALSVPNSLCFVLLNLRTFPRFCSNSCYSQTFYPLRTLSILIFIGREQFWLTSSLLRP